MEDVEDVKKSMTFDVCRSRVSSPWPERGGVDARLGVEVERMGWDLRISMQTGAASHFYGSKGLKAWTHISIMHKGAQSCTGGPT